MNPFGLNQGIGRAVFLSQGSREESVSYLFQLLEAIPLFLGSWPPSIFKARNGWASLSYSVSLGPSLRPPCSTYGALVNILDPPGSSRIISPLQGQLIGILDFMYNLNPPLSL